MVSEMKKIAYPEPFKKYVRSLADFCAYVVWAKEYELLFEFSTERRNVDSGNGTEDHMSIRVDPTYLYVTIWIYPVVLDYYRKKDYAGIAKNLLHEACHILVEPLSRAMMLDASPSQEIPFRRDIERQTQRICNSIWRLLPKDWYLPGRLDKEEQVGKKTRGR